MSHTDIKTIKLIEFMPAQMRPYAYLARLDRPIGWWLLLLPSWWAIVLASGGIQKMNKYDWMLIGLFFIGAIIMRAAGCIINDLWDKDLDRKVERTQLRPIASGAISTSHALIFLGILLLLSFFILMQLSLVSILIGFLSIPLIILYPLMKRITWWPQAFLGLTFNFGVLIGWSAVDMVIGIPCLILYIACFFWTLGYDTIYAHQDKEDDLQIGIKSTAIKFGSNSKKWVSIFYIISWLLILLTFISARAGMISYILLLLPAIQLTWQIKNWKMDNQDSSLLMFKSNRSFGLLVLLAAFS